MNDDTTPQNAAEDPVPEGMTPGDVVAAQMRAAYETVLSQLTTQGATRADLIDVTAKTCHAILETTSIALWPGGLAPLEEDDARVFLDRAAGNLEKVWTGEAS